MFVVWLAVSLYFLSADSHRLRLPVSIQEVGTCWHHSRQRGVDVRVRPRGIRPSRVVWSNFLLPSRLPWRWTAFSLRFCLGGQLHPDAAREAAVQSDAVLLGCLCPHWWPFLTGPTDDVLPGAASTCLATLLWHQRLAGHEPDSAFTCTSGNQKPHVWLLGQTGHLLVRGLAVQAGAGWISLK